MMDHESIPTSNGFHQEKKCHQNIESLKKSILLVVAFSKKLLCKWLKLYDKL